MLITTIRSAVDSYRLLESATSKGRDVYPRIVNIRPSYSSLTFKSLSSWISRPNYITRDNETTLIKDPESIAASKLFVPIGPVALTYVYISSDVSREEDPGVVGWAVIVSSSFF